MKHHKPDIEQNCELCGTENLQIHPTKVTAIAVKN